MRSVTFDDVIAGSVLFRFIQKNLLRSAENSEKRRENGASVAQHVSVWLKLQLR